MRTPATNASRRVPSRICFSIPEISVFASGTWAPAPPTAKTMSGASPFFAMRSIRARKFLFSAARSRPTSSGGSGYPVTRMRDRGTPYDSIRRRAESAGAKYRMLVRFESGGAQTRFTSLSVITQWSRSAPCISARMAAA